MKVTLHANEGERVSLSAPFCGDILVKTDPSAAAASMAMVLQTVPPAGAVPIHRYLQHPLLIWISKGQGRVMVGQRQYTVVPGNSAVIPAGEWYGLRNTGTGLFQVVWVAPASLIAFFKSLGQAKPPADPAALQALCASHGIEFQPEKAAALAQTAQQPARRFQRRRFHKSVKQQPQAAPVVSTDLKDTPSAPQSQAPPAPVISAQPPAPALAVPKPSKPANRGSRYPRRSAQPKPQDSEQRRPDSRERKPRYGHVKEVFMNGRWVRVSGEGPVVAS